MASSTKESTSKRIFVFDNPRNRSHLFARLVATHPQIDLIYHPLFLASLMGRDRIHYSVIDKDSVRGRIMQEQWDPICKEDLTTAVLQAALLKDLASTEQEKKMIPLINEHCCYVLKPEILIKHIKSREPVVDPAACDVNPTMLPDEVWHSITNPIIIIRHPALVLPSLYKSLLTSPASANLDPAETMFYWFGTLTWSRLLYDTLKKAGRNPVVVDGEDICTRTDQVIQALGKALDVDPAKITDTWEPSQMAPSTPALTEFTRSIWESSGVRKYESKGPVNIDDAVAAFTKEVGPELGQHGRKFIEDNMDNYRYLEQFKI